MNGIQLTALIGATASVAALAIAYFFMQQYLLLEPCPLCILDRFAVGAFGGGCLLLMFVWRFSYWRWGVWALNSIALAAGFVFAGRHIWLQHQPFDDAALCLSDSVAARSFMDLIGRAFDANADCGAIAWEFLGLSIPEQTLLLFVGLAVLHAVMMRQLSRVSV